MGSFGEYDYQYLKQLADNQRQTADRSGMVDALSKGLGDSADVQRYIPPQIARANTAEYYAQTAPDISKAHNLEQFRSGNDSPHFAGNHGAKLEVPYRYDPDMQQRVTDTVLTQFNNLVKHLTPNK